MEILVDNTSFMSIVDTVEDIELPDGYLDIDTPRIFILAGTPEEAKRLFNYYKDRYSKLIDTSSIPCLRLRMSNGALLFVGSATDKDFYRKYSGIQASVIVVHKVFDRSLSLLFKVASKARATVLKPLVFGTRS